MKTSTSSIDANLVAINQAQAKLIDIAMEFGPRLLVAMIILVAGFYCGRWVGRFVDRMLLKLHIDVSVRQLLVKICRLVLMALFMIMALQNIGVNLIPLIAGLGVAGAGVALAMQGVLSNLAAGFTIIFTRPYRVGQYISIAGEEGKVEDITLFSTTLSHNDLSRIVIPNRKISGEILHNYGELRQIGILVAVAYDTDIPMALKTVNDVLRRSSKVLQEPEPIVQISNLADSSITISINPWVKVIDYPVVTGEINASVLAAFRANSIIIPFPHYEVKLIEGGDYPEK